MTRTLADSSLRKLRYIQLLRLQLAILELRPAIARHRSAPVSTALRVANLHDARSRGNV